LDIVHVNVDFPNVPGAVTASDHEPLLTRFYVKGKPEPRYFDLQVLHASDLEGGVDALDRAPNFAAIVDKLEDNELVDASITLSAGDNYIPGPFFSAAGDASFGPVFNELYNTFYGLTGAQQYADLGAVGGRVDISIMNVIGFDASAVGNHEFDLGSDAFEQIIEEDFGDTTDLADDGWVGAQFPYLSSNLDFSGDADLGNLFTSSILANTAFETGPFESASGLSSTPKLAPATFIDVGQGEKVGVVGATTQLLDTISSPTGTIVIGPQSNDMPALAALIQPQVDTLEAMDIDKIVLVSHLQQISLEEELVTLLDGVDIVIAGGSDTLLANTDDDLREGDVADGQYPLITQDAAGDPAVIVSTDGEYSYVGQLVVRFDDEGELVRRRGRGPLEDLGDLELAMNGPVKTEAEDVADIWGLEDPFAEGSKGDLVTDLVDAAQNVVIAKDSNVVGETTVFIEGRREKVRTEETNLGDLTADANLALARTVDPTTAVSIKNGGGIRAEIGEVGDDGTLLPPQANPLSGKLLGQISQLDIENSLRFNNELSLITVTAAQLEAIVEHSVAATAPGATPGQFPQIAGMAFSFDPDSPVGSRVESLAIVDDAGAVVDVVVENGALQGDANRQIRVVTLNFLAGGGDGYPFPDNGTRVDLVGTVTDPGSFAWAAPGSEQDALAEYLATNHGIGDSTPFSEAETPPSGDERIQNLNERSDTVLP
jgi:alkaline phosphatase